MHVVLLRIRNRSVYSNFLNTFTHKNKEAGMEADRWKAGRQTDRQEHCFRGIQSLGLLKVFYISTHGRNVRSKSTSTSLGSNYSGILIVIPSPPYLPPPSLPPSRLSSLPPSLPLSHPPSLHIDVTSGVNRSSICMRPTNIWFIKCTIKCTIKCMRNSLNNYCC